MGHDPGPNTAFFLCQTLDEEALRPICQHFTTLFHFDSLTLIPSSPEGLYHLRDRIKYTIMHFFRGKDQNLFFEVSISVTICNIYFETQVLSIISLFLLIFLL